MQTLGRAILSTILHYWVNLLYILDVTVNTICGGDRRETISSRLGKGQQAGKPVHTVLAIFVNALFLLLLFEVDHCKNSIQSFTDTHAVSTIWAKYLNKYRRK